ncbi:CAP domain-containing protein [Candidatus Saccharibacteria bacterium]|nr:CAP domain-containing protein [Candidatus Saccharibacteria bacterium]
MSAAMLKQTRITILLSLNAVAILVSGILIASAIGFNMGGDFRVVDEKSDEVSGSGENAELIESAADTEGTPLGVNTESYVASSITGSSFDSGAVSGSELWNLKAITIYQTANIDICVNDTAKDIGEMYWQTSNADVIRGFYSDARTRLGYDSVRCRYPAIEKTGTTTITAGTTDGLKRDTLMVTVIEPPVEQWKREVLKLVNEERAKYNLEPLEWGATCEAAAQIRAEESMEVYAHQRPDGSSWDSVCKPEAGGAAGENLAAGNTAVSPETVVQTWMNSPSHRANILSDKFTKLSVGFVFDPSAQYKTYWSQFFSNY